jgi:hypothetical protein
LGKFKQKQEVEGVQTWSQEHLASRTLSRVDRIEGRSAEQTENVCTEVFLS